MALPIAAKSGAVEGDSTVSDGDLAWLVAEWPKLSAELRAKILHVAKVALQRMEVKAGLPS